MVMHHWSGPRAFTRYESWGSDPSVHGQYTGGKESVIKEVDPWEIPRHHVRVCSILGEGSFGQVWKCEAYNVLGKGPLKFLYGLSVQTLCRKCTVCDMRVHTYYFRVQGQYGGRGQNAQGQRGRTRATRPGTGTTGDEIARTASARRQAVGMLFGKRYALIRNTVI